MYYFFLYIVSGNKTKIFVTIPRFSSGRPFTLATINIQPGSNSQPLKPYPDYSWHVNQGENCGGMTSVFRIAVPNEYLHFTIKSEI